MGVQCRAKGKMAGVQCTEKGNMAGVQCTVEGNMVCVQCTAKGNMVDVPFRSRITTDNIKFHLQRYVACCITASNFTTQAGTLRDNAHLPVYY